MVTDVLAIWKSDGIRTMIALFFKKMASETLYLSYFKASRHFPVIPTKNHGNRLLKAVFLLP